MATSTLQTLTWITLLFLLLQQVQSLNGTLCSNQIKNICRNYLSENVVCYEKVSQMLCSAYRMQCTQEVVIVNPPCKKYCLETLNRCKEYIRKFSSYYPEYFCDSLPTTMCADSLKGNVVGRDSRSTEQSNKSDSNTDKCNATTQCNNVTFVRNVMRKNRKGVPRAKYSFKKKHFKHRGYSYAAVIKFAKVEWRRSLNTAALKRSGNDVQLRNYSEIIVHLEILEILYYLGYKHSYLMEGSVQILNINASCNCLPMKLYDQYIFVGQNDFVKNLFGDVAILPRNSHYVCKISRCWQRSRGPRKGHRICSCPCGKHERKLCRKRKAKHLLYQRQAQRPWNPPIQERPSVFGQRDWLP